GINTQLRALGVLDAGVDAVTFDYSNLQDKLVIDLSKLHANASGDTVYGDRFEALETGKKDADGEVTGMDFAQFFHLTGNGTFNAFGDPLYDVSALGRPIIRADASGIITSAEDIDTGGDGSDSDPRELTKSIALNKTLFELGQPLSPLPPLDNQITFGNDPDGVTNDDNIDKLSMALADFLNLSNKADDTTGGANITSSSPDISSTSNINPGETRKFTQLLTADLPPAGLISGNLVLDGVNLFQGDAKGTDVKNHTLNEIVAKINSFAPPDGSNRSYDAVLNPAGTVTITVRDSETLTPAVPAPPTPSSNPALDTSGAVHEYFNQLVRDSANPYTPTGAGAPPTYPTGAGGVPTSFSNSPPGAPYPTSGPNNLFVDPTGAEIPVISPITFGGQFSISSLLGLNDAGDHTVSGPTITQRQYQAGYTDHLVAGLPDGTYDLFGTVRATFAATSSTSTDTSNPLFKNGVGKAVVASGGLDLSSLPADGIVAMVSVQPAIIGNYEDKGIVFQIGGNEGNTSRFNVGDLSSVTLEIEGIKTYQSGDTDVMARLRGTNALRVVDYALSLTQDALNDVGVRGEILENNQDLLGTLQINLAKSLSDIQDADLDEEISLLTKAQLTQQTTANLLAQNYAHTQNIYSLLFGGLGI
ncbi:MAG: flagellin, partial [Candidatus Sericytochromatia bacterium]